MKRILTTILALSLILALVGCTKQNNPSGTDMTHIDGTLEDLMAKIYENSGLTELPKLGNTAIDSENMSYYLGTDSFKITEGLASEAMISAIPFSVCLLRLDPGTDVDAAKAAVKENANPNKWICVGVDDSNVVVDNLGDLMILIMADESEAIHNGFLALAGK